MSIVIPVGKVGTIIAVGFGGSVVGVVGGCGVGFVVGCVCGAHPSWFGPPAAVLLSGQHPYNVIWQ